MIVWTIKKNNKYYQLNDRWSDILNIHCLISNEESAEDLIKIIEGSEKVRIDCKEVKPRKTKVTK